MEQQTNNKVLILGASAESVPFIELLLKEGLSLVCLDKKPDLPVELLERHHLNLKCLALDFSQVDLVKELVRKEHISHTIALPVGRSLVVLGQINDEFHFAGPSYAITDTLTNKLKFHEFCAAHDINHAPYISLAPEHLPLSADTIEHIEQTLGYPLIAKPNTGSGSLGVRMIASRSDLLSYKLPERFAHNTLLLEKLIVGNEYSVNIFVDAQGQCHIMGIFKKELSPEPYRQEVAYFSGDFSKELAIIKPFFANLVKKLGLRSSFVNADTLICQQSNSPIVVDISPRLGGNNILTLLLQLGHNPLAIFHQALVQRKPLELQAHSPSSSLVMRFLSFPQRFTYQGAQPCLTPSEQEHIVKAHHNLQIGQSYGPMEQGADTARGCVLVQHDSLELANALSLKYVRSLM